MATPPELPGLEPVSQAVLLPLARIPAHFAAELGGETAAVIHGDEIVSWHELERTSTAMALALRARGVGKGAFVTIALANGGELYKLTFALWKLGATPHIVSWKLPSPELKAILELMQPKLLVTRSAAFNQAFGGISPDALLSSNASIDAAPLQNDIVAPHWKAMSSGGSTGRPKIIVDHMPAVADPNGSAMTLPRRSVILNPGPLSHNAPFIFTHMALFQGNTVVSMEKFDAEEALNLIDKYKVEWVNMVPTMMSRMWRLPAEVRARYDLSSLKTVWHMAAPMPPWLKQAWIEWIGPERLWELYGGTERTGSTVINGVEWLQHKGSVGKPGPDVVLRIRDDAGNDLPVREVGEIFLGPKNLQTTYHYIGAESHVSGDGLQSLGDFGWLDDDGYLYLADRRTDLVLSGGANLYPAEVEGALMEHPGVEVAVVIGLPHEDLGASVHAIVRPRQDWPGALNAETLGAFVRERLALYKTPRSYEFTQEELRDDAGKARRSQLREARLANN